MVRTEPVPRPTKKSEYNVVFATKQAQKGWTDLAATTRNALADAWDFLTHTPHVSSQTAHQLKGQLATIAHHGLTNERWQYELPGGARIWYFVTAGGKTAGTVHVFEVHTHHPNATK